MKVRDEAAWDTERQTTIPSDGQRVADDPLTATSVLNVHRDGRRVGHVSETTLETNRNEERYLNSRVKCPDV